VVLLCARVNSDDARTQLHLHLSSGLPLPDPALPEAANTNHIPPYPRGLNSSVMVMDRRPAGLWSYILGMQNLFLDRGAAAAVRENWIGGVMMWLTRRPLVPFVLYVHPLVASPLRARGTTAATLPSADRSREMITFFAPLMSCLTRCGSLYFYKRSSVNCVPARHQQEPVD
jgi:hypothetical protein